MYTIHRNGMPRKKKEGAIAHFQLKLYGEEAERWQQIFELALSRNRRYTATDVNRRLLNLDPDTDGVVTERDRSFFLGGKRRADMLGRTKESKPHIQEVSPRLRRK
jgi:hypothetical protein